VTAASPASRTVSRRHARALALAAQGFGRAARRDAPSDVDIRAAIQRIGVLQLDSVNVLCRSHYLPVYSRLGPYDRAILDRMAAHTAEAVDRELIEYWGHEASLLTPELYPLLHWRMGRADLEAWKFVVSLAHAQPQLIEETLALVAAQGPLRAGQTGQRPSAPQPGQMWNWHDGKNALEYLFYSGRVATARRVNFERFYDLPERALPAEVLAAASVGEDEAQRHLIMFAAAALGIAAEADMGDYFRLTRTDSKRRVAELVDSGELQAVDVEGWTMPAYALPDLDLGKAPPISASALLSPFDSLIWTRDRTRRLFEFDYHIEIYTPAAKRRYGYYVLPFLLGDALVARVDLKTDRKQRTLIAQGAFAEAGVDSAAVAAKLAGELRAVATWLELESVRVVAHGDLAPALAAEVG
jgi:uncharacterized protein YcaQ